MSDLFSKLCRGYRLCGYEAALLTQSLQAGANGIFVPGVSDPSPIEVLVREIPGPLNLMVMPGIPAAPDLFQLGVARLSLGGAAMLAAMGLVWEIAHELRKQGTYQKLSQHAEGMSQTWMLFA